MEPSCSISKEERTHHNKSSSHEWAAPRGPDAELSTAQASSLYVLLTAPGKEVLLTLFGGFIQQIFSEHTMFQAVFLDLGMQLQTRVGSLRLPGDSDLVAGKGKSQRS